MTKAFVVAALVATAAGAQQWRSSEKALADAYNKKDWQAMRGAALDLLELRGVPDDLYNLACAEALAGHPEAALERLREFSAAGVFAEVAKDPDLASVQRLPGWPKLLESLQANLAPVHRAAPLVDLPAGLLTEDVVWSKATRTYYVSSVRRRKIIAVAEGGAVRDFVAEGQGGLWSVFGLALDAGRGSLWATTAAVPHGEGVSKAEQGRTALVRYALATGREEQRWEVPAEGGPHLLGDLAVGPQGDAYASDTHGAVYRVRRKGAALEVLVPKGVLASPQTPAPLADGRTLLVPDYAKGIAAVNLETKEVRWLQPGRGVALNGIDGLYAVGPALLAVQNGTRPARVVRLWPDAGHTRVDRLEVLEARSPGLGEPTHGTLADGRFVFIANAGWGRYGQDGSVKKDAEKDAPALWWVAALPADR